MTAPLQISDTKVQMPDKDQVSNNKKIVDLENRFSSFGEAVIVFCKVLSVDHISRPVVSQLVRSATGIGANYLEANNGSSKRDFLNKVYIAKKEAQESSHWLRMLRKCFPGETDEIARLSQEAHELTLILQSIVNKVNQRSQV